MTSSTLGIRMTGIGTERFNRACRTIALLWLIAGVPLTVVFRPMRSKDFPQFYMGGVIVRHAQWQALYPTPEPRSLCNPGLAGDSYMHPTYAALAQKYAVETGDEPRFIQPPPNALFYWPLSYIPYPLAYPLWTVLMGACATAVAIMAGRIYEMCAGRKSRLAGLTTLLVASSYLVYYVIRATNTEMLLSALIGVAVLGLITGQTRRPAAAICLGTINKYALAMLLPLVVAMRRWNLLAWAVGIGLVVTGISVLTMGLGPVVVFASEIFPLLSRPYAATINQSMDGAIIHYSGLFPLPHWISMLVRLASLLVLGLLLGLIFTRPQSHWLEPVRVFAAAAALLTWLLIFSPLSWEKYHTYLCPLWGWLLWESFESRRRAITVGVVLASVWAPPILITKLDLPEPFTFHMLAASMLMMGLAVARLCSPLRQASIVRPAQNRVGSKAGPLPEPAP